MLNVQAIDLLVGATGFEPATPSPPESFSSVNSSNKSSGLRQTASFKPPRISARFRVLWDNLRHGYATMHTLPQKSSLFLRAGVCAKNTLWLPRMRHWVWLLSVMLTTIGSSYMIPSRIQLRTGAGWGRQINNEGVR